jgi:hypothetical protein
MRGVEIGIQLKRTLERGNCATIIAILEANFTEIKERIDQQRIALRRLAKFRNGHIKLSLLMRLDAGLHVLGAIR